MMWLSPAGLKFLAEQESEGGVPRLKAYRDTGGVWTIGFGHIRDVHEGDTCTSQQAYNWLEDEAEEVEIELHAVVSTLLNQNQFDALVSFVFNIGETAFDNSTILKLINDDRMELAALQFIRWNKDNGKVIEGLTNRRLREKALFETPV